MAVTGPATVGDNCIDRYLPPIGHDLAGGNALNVAAGLASAGLPAAYVGAVGDDADGRLIVSEGELMGIDMSRVAVAPGQTGVTTITLTPDGERVFESEVYGTSAGFHPCAEATAFLRTRSWVHATGPAPLADVLETVAEAGVPISYDVSHPPRTEHFEAIAPLLRVAFLSAAGATTAEARDLARAAVGRGARSAVVGRGQDGCLMLSGDEVVEQAAPPARVVDTLGAGDALIAGVIAALLEGASPAAALARGAQAAAAACTHVGAWRPPEPLEAHG
jgi:fructoselysine 6-kinase